MKKHKSDRRRNSRSNRLKYAYKEGKKAYRRGKTSKAKRAKDFIFGKNATGFLGRVGGLGLVGGGVAAAKIGGNITRSGQNIEDATQAFKKSAQHAQRTTSQVAKEVNTSATQASKDFRTATGDLRKSASSMKRGASTIEKGINNAATSINNVTSGSTLKSRWGKSRKLLKNRAKRDIEITKNYLRGSGGRTRDYMRRRAEKDIAARRQRFGFTSNNNNLNFMSTHNYNNYANFSEEELDYALEAALEEIDEQYKNGELTDEEADELEADLEDQYEEALEQLEEEEEFEASVYDGELANFSAATDLGERIMEYIVEEDPEDPEETIVDLAYSLQLVDEEGYQLEGEDAIEGVLGLMTGEVLPDESLLSGLADYFELDEDEVDEIVDLTQDQLEAQGYVETDYDDDEPEDAYGKYEGGDGHGNDYVDELENNIDELEGELEEVGELAEQAFSRIENLEANFAIAEAESEVSSNFNNLEQEAYSLVESGQMPPTVFEENYGDFADTETQLAAFSQVCDSKGVDFSAELYRLDGINETYADMEPNISFSQMSYNDPNSNDYDTDDATIAQAVRNVRNRTYGQDFGKPINFGQSDQDFTGEPNNTPLATGTYGGNIQSIGEHSRAL